MIFFSILIMIGCRKTTDIKDNEEALAQGRIKNPNPPPTVYFYFNNCSNPAINGNFVAGTPANATITLNYINSPGGAYPVFLSNIVNGIRLSAPAGILNVGSGSIVFTAYGTPTTPGIISIPVSIRSSITCNLPITVLNAPTPGGNCSDPSATVGSTGCVTFTYRSQQVTYKTVRARDGKIWLQQNVGSPQVALHGQDAASFGHYFQWGRWDDGHQVPTGNSVTGSTSLQNPSHIPSGNPNFIKGTTTSTSWWGTGGNAGNTWSGTTITANNGKDPCSAIGAGWHLPSAAEWTNLVNEEWISDATSAFQSSLKLTESGYRNSPNAIWYPNFVGGYYWTSTAANSNTAKKLFFDAAYNLDITIMERGYGVNCRCVKN
jgi:uncharacterized protein (TIGR02145 family)